MLRVILFVLSVLGLLIAFPILLIKGEMQHQEKVALLTEDCEKRIRDTTIDFSREVDMMQIPVAGHVEFEAKYQLIYENGRLVALKPISGTTVKASP